MAQIKDMVKPRTGPDLDGLMAGLTARAEEKQRQEEADCRSNPGRVKTDPREDMARTLYAGGLYATDPGAVDLITPEEKARDLKNGEDLLRMIREMDGTY